MILYKDWGKHIRLGNFLFLYAGLSSFCKKTGNQLVLPDYFMWKYLKNPPKIDSGLEYDEIFHFRTTQYSKQELDWILEQFSRKETLNVNLGSHLQSQKWWEDDKEFVKDLLSFKEYEIERIRDKYSHVFTKPVIGIGIRRGDFVNHGCFYQIPLTWYEKALKYEFKDIWQDCNILFFSDNIDEIRKIFKGDNYFFAHPNNTHTHADNFKHYHNDPMEQFILGTMCNHFIGGSSTFSYWQMWYVFQNGGKVVHSGKNLIGECAEKHKNPDYYPLEWTYYP